MNDDVQGERVAGCHWLLLRLAGTVADDLISQCRQWLAEERTSDVGRAVAYAVLSQRVPLKDAEIDLLSEVISAADVDSSALSMVEVIDTEPLPKYAFADSWADANRGARLGAADGRPAVPATSAEPDDDIDRAMLGAVGQYPAVRALWRVWRFPGDGAPWPPPRRLYVVEADRGVMLAGLAAGLQAVAARAGEVDPQVEVYPVHGDLPSYQRLARAYGALLWTRDPDPGLKIAAVFDALDDSGPHMAANHVVVSGPKARRLADYLNGGQPLLLTTAKTDDVVDAARRSAVPTNFRTDGRWIWNDATTYYLTQHGLQPDPELVAHIEGLDYVSPEVDGAAIHRALAVLQEPAADEPAWTVGT